MGRTSREARLITMFIFRDEILSGPSASYEPLYRERLSESGDVAVLEALDGLHSTDFYLAFYEGRQLFGEFFDQRLTAVGAGCMVDFF